MKTRLSVPILAIALVASVPGNVYAQARSRPSGDKAALAIQTARATYRESELAVARGSWSQRDTSVTCDEHDFPFDVRIHRDSTGMIRRLQWSGGTDDHAESHRYFYDARGKLRFAFFTLGAVNGTQYEERVYFGTSGEVVRRLPRLVKGPGYALRGETGMADPEHWRRTLCA